MDMEVEPKHAKALAEFYKDFERELQGVNHEFSKHKELIEAEDLQAKRLFNDYVEDVSKTKRLPRSLLDEFKKITLSDYLALENLLEID